MINKAITTLFMIESLDGKINSEDSNIQKLIKTIAINTHFLYNTKK